MKKMLLVACLCALLVPAAAFAQDAPKPDAKPAKIDITGVWDVLFETPQGQMNIIATYKQEGEKLTGTQASPMGEVALQGTVVGNEVKYTIVVDFQGQQATISFGAKVEGDAMTGVFEFGGMGTGPWSAKKRPSAS
jgi:hypothetical protein